MPPNISDKTTVVSPGRAPATPRPAARDDGIGSSASSDRPAGTLPTPVSTCELCGATARVQVLEGYANGQPVVRRFCLVCASGPALAPGSEERNARPSVWTIIALLGVALGVLGAFGDLILPNFHAGFGWYQRCGVVVGVLLGLLGVLMRIDVLALGGAGLFIVSLGADWLGLRHSPGVGWKQQLVLALAVVCMLLALLRRRVKAGRDRGGSSRC